MALPTHTAQWVLSGQNGFQDLKYQESVPIPSLGDHDCLIKIGAVSLNFRDIAIAMGVYPPGASTPVVPISDGAGTIVAVGPRVRNFKPGDRVCPLNTPGHLSGKMNPNKQHSTLGGHFDGVLREYAVFEDQVLVPVPNNLSLVEASTLPGAAVTAWNILYGSLDAQLKPGDIILTQGTGGTSLFVIQFALSAGATVIATTSSTTSKKAEILKQLGVQHIINYTTDPHWGETAKSLTPGGVGVDHVVDLAGTATLEQSLKALRYEGMLSAVGFLSGVNDGMGPGLLETLLNAVTVRGLIGGSKLQFEEMNRAIEQRNIKPVVDEKIFGFSEIHEAYQYLVSQKHVGKVVIKIE
ncbi:alcohol dehydrogenase [Xylogone sp. PMI_703]|nr:alcohol dehydrogenase [Xylogone sp. PMI_703]